MGFVRDLTKCRRCGAPIPQYDWGRGEWHYPTREDPDGELFWPERGPYCDMDCLKADVLEEIS